MDQERIWSLRELCRRSTLVLVALLAGCDVGTPPEKVEHTMRSIGRYSKADGAERIARLTRAAQDRCAAIGRGAKVWQTSFFEQPNSNFVIADIRYNCAATMAEPANAASAAEPASPAGTAEAAPAIQPLADAQPYRLVISFNSHGEGPHAASIDEVARFLEESQREFDVPLPRDFASWGREGEFVWCLSLAGLDERAQVDMVSRLRARVTNTNRAAVRENAPCSGA